MRKRHGYTLLEILVVILIISIVAAVALLSIHYNHKKQLQTFALELAQMISLAKEQAILQPAIYGLAIADHSYQFLRLQQDDQQLKSWVPVNDALFTQHASMQQVVQLELEMSGIRALLPHENKTDPQIIISTSGEVTPFTLTIHQPGESSRYALSDQFDGIQFLS